MGGERSWLGNLMLDVGHCWSDTEDMPGHVAVTDKILCLVAGIVGHLCAMSTKDDGDDHK